MAELSKRELEAIIERDLPGHELVSVDPDPGRPAAAPLHTTGSDIGALRRKFLGDTGLADSAGGRADNEHDVIVAVRPKHLSGPTAPVTRAKTVVVSGRDKRVIGQQG